MRIVQTEKARMAVPSKTIVQRDMGRPWGKHFDNPQHLENSIEIYLQELVKLNHMLLF